MPLTLIGLRGFSIVAKFMLALYTARYLGLADLGIYGLVVGMTLLMPAVFGFGLNDWMLHDLVGKRRAEFMPRAVTRLTFTVCAHLVVQPIGWAINAALGSPIPFALAAPIATILLLEHLMIHVGYRGSEIPKPLFIYTASMSGMLMGHSSQRHAGLWRRIRQKHRALYRLPNLVRIYWKSRGQRTEMSVLRPITLLLLTGILPDAWYNAFIRISRNHRMAASNRVKAALGHAQVRPEAGV